MPSSGGPLTLSSSTSMMCSNERGEKKRFRLQNGKIVYQVLAPGKCQPWESPDWFGCSFCNRWFQNPALLEEHYSKEHEGADSYKFELLELKNCVIELPYILSTQSSPPQKPNPAKKAVPKESSNNGGDDDDLNLRLSKLNLCTESKSVKKLSMKKSIRQAIKATQVNGNGSSYKKIKAYLVNKAGMSKEKVNRKLRKILERFVENNKLKRGYNKGKTLYSQGSSKKGKGGGKMAKGETRRYRDQQLKLIAKSLKPHGLRPH